MMLEEGGRPLVVGDEAAESVAALDAASGEARWRVGRFETENAAKAVTGTAPAKAQAVAVKSVGSGTAGATTSAWTRAVTRRRSRRLTSRRSKWTSTARSTRCIRMAVTVTATAAGRARPARPADAQQTEHGDVGEHGRWVAASSRRPVSARAPTGRRSQHPARCVHRAGRPKNTPPAATAALNTGQAGCPTVGTAIGAGPGRQRQGHRPQVPASPAPRRPVIVWSWRRRSVGRVET